ncbi:containing Condensation domain-containing protein, putative [Babesia ovata]|uniref:Containing Condensation domain-containing protein, putative n=1 Tax=Babesia ovata TaxID=189622 RepID=A0A2H6KAZ7_9APIC|nr:containing Condensation domain-containing protein, putative [Babesia ovata]GBE60156.1 containing Condensation domain-containing protein, putative [Babesia ovata]
MFIRQHKRRGVTSLIFLSAISIKCVLSAVPGGLDASYSDVPPDIGIAFYACNEQFNRKVRVLESLSWSVMRLRDDLILLRPDLRQSNDSSEIIKANIKECGKLIDDLELVSSASRDYDELREMLNDYRGITRRLKREQVKPETPAELNTELMHLEQVFEKKKVFASDVLRSDTAHHYREIAKRALTFIRQHQINKSRSPHFRVQELWRETEANPPASEADLVGDIEQPAEADSNTESEGGNEMMRKILNDRSELRSFYKVQADAKKILDMVHESLMNDAEGDAENSPPDSNKHILKYIPSRYDKSYDDIKDVINAWNVYKRYNDISDKMGKVYPKTPQAVELIREQKRLEVAFEEYAFLLRSSTLEDLWRELSHILHGLELYAINKYPKPKRHGTTLSAEETNHQITDEEKVTGGSYKTVSKYGIASHMRIRKVDLSSRFLTLGIGVVQTLTALVMIAVV